MSETINQAKLLQSLKSTDVVRNEYVRTQFINVYDMIWKQGGEAAFEREAINFNKQLRDNENLRKCTPISIFFAFIDLAVRGLSLEQGAQALCYLLPRNYKAGLDANGKDVWEKRCNLTISGYGELVLRAKAGQIRHADNPVIVYEGDEFAFGEVDGRKYVNYQCKLPRTSNKIVACFIKITRIDGTTDYSIMLEADWERLAGYSAKNNSYYDATIRQRVEKANELYSANDGQIDTGFLVAKCIKHAFKSYPRIPIGKGSQFESDITEEQTADFDPYGGITDEQQTQPQQESFAVPRDTSEGLTVDPAAQGDNDDTF
ncbi:recombinase RecT [Prevotella intermedia]|uniref:Recombinase RecT n=1 Tax=Prevotella intermedia TaxID=28131 RepID=A0A2A6EFH8_PREIN|nr:recombinase RecT [Prevotella intermedia]PDP60174.1 hypothetical protein CLI71_07035 [Prevotella intermedia]